MWRLQLTLSITMQVTDDVREIAPKRFKTV